MRKSKDNKLIDDSGIHMDFKERQIFTFVTLCRIFTVILMFLGLCALIYGNI